MSPLLHAIANKKIEIAKYLIFRKADLKLTGEVSLIQVFSQSLIIIIKIFLILKYGDALITAIHYDSPINFVTLLLEKGANLAARHSHWVI